MESDRKIVRNRIIILYLSVNNLVGEKKKGNFNVNNTII